MISAMLSNAVDPQVETGRGEHVSSAVIAAIVIVVILLVLIVIDLLCCYYNSCGVFFCFQKTCCQPKKDKKCKYCSSVSSLWSHLAALYASTASLIIS